MQFPVGVALRDPTNFAAGQAESLAARGLFHFHILSFSFRPVSSEYLYLRAKSSAILVLLWQKRREKEQKEIRSGRKGREERSICRQWFWACPVYHVILKLILWFGCMWHSGSSREMGPYSTQHTALIMETNGTET